MHVFKCHSFRNVIYALSVPIVTEPLCGNHIVNFLLCCQSQTVYVWLRQDSTHKSVTITSKAYHFHGRFWKEVIMQRNGIKSFLCGGIDGSSFFYYRCVSIFIINLCFRALGYHWAKLPYEDLL